MSLESRFESLQTRHARLEAQLGSENQRPSPNLEEVHRLKREKLRVKEELERLRGNFAAH
jgi:hypothetical protein